MTEMACPISLWSWEDGIMRRVVVVGSCGMIGGYDIDYLFQICWSSSGDYGGSCCVVVVAIGTVGVDGISSLLLLRW